MKEAFNTRPHLPYDFNIYNKGRIEIYKNSFRELPILYNAVGKHRSEIDNHYLLIAAMNQMPGSIHISMFVKCIEIMGTNEQHKEYLDKSLNYDMIGCYAQT